MSEAPDKSQYPISYGVGWNPPDFARCAQRIFFRGVSRQCRRFNGYGPGGAWCKAHDPDHVKFKRDLQRGLEIDVPKPAPPAPSLPPADMAAGWPSPPRIIGVDRAANGTETTVTGYVLGGVLHITSIETKEAQE